MRSSNWDSWCCVAGRHGERTQPLIKFVFHASSQYNEVIINAENASSNDYSIMISIGVVSKLFLNLDLDKIKRKKLYGNQ